MSISTCRIAFQAVCHSPNDSQTHDIRLIERGPIEDTYEDPAYSAHSWPKQLHSEQRRANEELFQQHVFGWSLCRQPAGQGYSGPPHSAVKHVLVREVPLAVFTYSQRPTQNSACSATHAHFYPGAQTEGHKKPEQPDKATR